jgi:hypothetical protein
MLKLRKNALPFGNLYEHARAHIVREVPSAGTSLLI